MRWEHGARTKVDDGLEMLAEVKLRDKELTIDMPLPTVAGKVAALAQATPPGEKL